MKRILSPLNKVKTLFTLALFCAYYTTFATVKTTVADGNWFTASNWSPAGVPMMEDTVIVNHNMNALGDKVEFGANWLIVSGAGNIVCDSIFALHGNLKLNGTMDINEYVDGDGDSTLIYGTLSGWKTVLSNPVAINYGEISSDSLVLSEEFHNYGMIETNFMTTGSGTAPLINHSAASIVVADSAIFSAEVVNEVNAAMVIGSLMTDILITNNGEISCESWSHLNGTANGTGKYCVQGCFQNFADIEGTLDICDASPGAFCDWDFGTVASGITFCASSPCSNSLEIDESTFELTIYPNPATSYIMINNVEGGSQWTILDFNGKRIVSGTITADITQLDVSGIPAGVYMLQIQNDDNRTTHRFVKN